MLKIRHGAQEVDMTEATSRKKAPSIGTGYRLGTGNEPSEVIPGGPKVKQAVILLKSPAFLVFNSNLLFD